MNSATRELVCNTGPVIALVAATGSLKWLAGLYQRILIPCEVIRELEAGGADAPESALLNACAEFIQILPPNAMLPTGLANALDLGEASVNHTALEQQISTVAIDEKAGRRVARLHGLSVTGSLGILVRAKKEGVLPSVSACLQRMEKQNIWLADELVNQALIAAGESAV